MSNKIHVYIAGPYSGGDVEANVKTAIEAGNKIALAGMYPFIPHLYHYWHQHLQQDYEFWMDQCFAFLEKCDVLVRLPGVSPGADREVQRAREQGIPVHSLGYVIETYPPHLHLPEDSIPWVCL